MTKKSAIGVGNLAEQLGVSARTVQNWVEKGVLVQREDGGRRRRFDRSEVVLAHLFRHLLPYQIPAPVLKSIALMDRGVLMALLDFRKGSSEFPHKHDAECQNAFLSALAGDSAFLAIHVYPGSPRDEIRTQYSLSRAGLDGFKTECSKIGAAVIEIDLKAALAGVREFLDNTEGNAALVQRKSRQKSKVRQKTNA